MTGKLKRPCASYEPTPQEIREACQRIRSRWSDHERSKRSGEEKRDPWITPVVNASGLRETLRDVRNNKRL